MRIDKFLWCIRLARTRSEGTQMSSSGRVKIDGEDLKPSKSVYPGAVISIRSNPIWRTFKVLQLPASRVGAKLVINYLIETTPASDLEQLNLIAEANRENHKLGLKGRPTKKNRRDLDEFRD